MKKFNVNFVCKVLFAGFILLGFFLLLCARSNFVLSDTAWHLKVGDYILRTRNIPKQDTFSLLGSTETMKFIPHEWLSEVIYSLVYKLFSLNGLYILAGVFVYVSFMFFIVKSKNIFTGTLLTCIFIAVNFITLIQIRPDIFGIFLLVLSGYNFAFNSDKKCIEFNVLLSVLIANLHGGSVSVNLIQQLWIVICLFCLSNKKVPKDKVIVILTTLFSSLLNPSGINIFKYIFIINTSNAEYSGDWVKLQFDNVFQVLIVLSIFALALYNWGRKQDKSTSDKLSILIMFMYLVMVFTFDRTKTMFVFAFILYMSKYIDLKRIWGRCFKIIATCVSAYLIIFFILNKKLPNCTMQEYIYNNIITSDIINEVSDKRYFNELDLGGYLIYLDKKPFIDTRGELYLSAYGNTELFTPYIKSLYSETLMKGLTDKYNLDYLLLRRNSLTSQIFYTSDDWEVFKECKEVVLFKKNNMKKG